MSSPLANRVDPSGAIQAVAARGTLMGNRGGRIHLAADPETGEGPRLGRRRWASRQWICCVLAFKGRRRQVMGPGYTELFFLDEATALAAGHRPCFECRRAEALAFAEAWADAAPLLSHLRDRGRRLGVLTRNTALGARLTLEAAGLTAFFAPGDVLGRDDAPAKPDPAGVLRLLEGWGAVPEQAVVVGDWVHDLRAGTRAGAAAVLVRRHGPQDWEHEADHVIDQLGALIQLSGAQSQ